MPFDLLGLVAPFDRLGYPRVGGPETLRRGCFTAAIARGGVAVRVDHRKGAAAIIADDVHLWESYAGLCLAATVRADAFSQKARQLVQNGHARGWSVTMVEGPGFEAAYSRPPIRHRTVLAVPRLIEISLMLTIPPAYRDTWAALATPDAYRRLAREDRDARERELEDLEATA